MLRLAVVGKDVSASLSPQIHAFILAQFGERCTYEKVSIPPAEFSTRAEKLFATYDAFNVTIPYKTEIIPLLNELRGDASSLGAVNTVLAAGRAGYNTDGFGFLLMLENAGIEVRGKRVLVLGAGGAGRSCIKSLSDAGAEVHVYERDPARLEACCRELGCFMPLRAISSAQFDIVVNCTGIGMHDTVGQTPSVRNLNGEEIPIGADLLSRCDVAVDLIYKPEESEFLRIARSCRKQTISGGAMLFYQAYYADCIFLKRAPSAAEAKKFYERYKGDIR